MIDKHSKILFLAITLLTVMSVAATYYKYVTLRDFVIIDDVEEEFIDADESE